MNIDESGISISDICRCVTSKSPFMTDIYCGANGDETHLW